MSRSKFWYVNCDVCGEEGSGGEGSYAYGPTLTKYLKKLRAEGWTFDKKDICENCNGNAAKRIRAAQGKRGDV